MKSPSLQTTRFRPTQTCTGSRTSTTYVRHVIHCCEEKTIFMEDSLFPYMPDLYKNKFCKIYTYAHSLDLRGPSYSKYTNIPKKILLQIQKFIPTYMYIILFSNNSSLYNTIVSMSYAPQTHWLWQSCLTPQGNTG